MAIEGEATGSPESSFRRIGLALVGFLALLVFGFFAYRWVAPVPEEKTVAQQWNEAISRLGIEPIYPPQEDVAVGDVFVLITEDALSDVAKEPLAGRALKLWHMDLTEKLEQTYAEMYRFPETPDPPAEGKPWKLASSTASVFKSGSPRGDLPLVLFPGFSISSTRNATLGANSSEWFGGMFGGSASSETTTEVRISAAESYGLPGLVAEAELIKFCADAVLKVQCTDAEARKQMSIVVGGKIFEQVEDPKTKKLKPRFSLEIALVSRIFLTRSMHTTIRRTGSGRGSASTGEAKPGTASPPGKHEGAGQSSETAKPEAVVPNSPGVTSSLQFGSSSVISTIDTLQRPVAFGYRSVRWIPGDGS
ncbi:hypothetical protein IVA88_24955 [Bradyrhizobium sp. 149]|uniref:hypothetical protein n=1 Tax=Bradyrhizobium sp. 149 TaxID=2782624 RepID=UPI001FFB6540|nr:hypothetical protein [Bradyrhizobium sp. 149]MCK1654670.1 hypothetical protein [Bradyrhizobium sp. 149]